MTSFLQGSHLLKFQAVRISPGRSIALNAELAKLWPAIIERQAPPDDADEWKEVGDKLRFLQR